MLGCYAVVDEHEVSVAVKAVDFSVNVERKIL
jgi:hypothetical protein